MLPNESTFCPVLRHGDFRPSNILYDASSYGIGGIIDFSSAGLGDTLSTSPHSSAPSLTGSSFADLLAPTYPQIDALLHRARSYVDTFALQEALWGLEHDDRAAFEHGMAEYV